MRNKKIPGLAAGLLLSIFAIGGLPAQSVPGGFQSPTSAATFGIFRSAADDFISTDRYMDAKIANWFAMTSFMNPNLAHIGYAKKLEAVYIGLYYGGTFWANIRNPEYTETRATWLAAPKDNVRIYDGVPDIFGDPNPHNRFSLLIGGPGAGVRFSIYSSMNAFSDSDFIERITEIDIEDDIETETIVSSFVRSYQAENGVISPQVAISAGRELTENGFKPFIDFDLDFYRDNARQQVYVNDGAAWRAGDEYVLKSQNYVQPQVHVGLGGYNFASRNGYTGSVDLDYRLRLRTYDNEYNYTDSTGKNKIATFSGLFGDDGEAPGLEELTYNNHRIRLSLGGSWSGETLGFKINLNLPIEITNQASKPLALEEGTVTGKLVQNGREVIRTDVGFAPQLQLAAQWRALPRLTLNVGGQITLTSLGQATVETGKEFANGKVAVPEDGGEENVSSKLTAALHGADIEFENKLAVGVALYATDNLTFEAAAGIKADKNIISVFDTDNGLFAFANLLVSLKF